MMNFSQKLGKSIVVIAIAGSAVIAYSELQTSETDTVQVSRAAIRADHVKVENISLDYTRAHMELMKLPDETPANAF